MKNAPPFLQNFYDYVHLYSQEQVSKQWYARKTFDK